ncbi:asparagine synthase-related protein [Winogradskyella sp. A3E31]|uniref:asparagine synthase-related protein n=1 Tax=Winogradskyella sp. A3E31 TaxID=3349637 RepID=UPI00398AD57B
MKQIKQPIIPNRILEVPVDAEKELDLKAICTFTAIGFFLDTDTYWTHKKVVPPASLNTFNANGQLETSKPYFKWHYTPRDISFEQALEEFTDLFESIISEQTNTKKVILPLSGGLDSRTQATALRHIGAQVQSYSYEFEHGYPETKIAKEIAQACHFQFKSYTIKKGDLWSTLDQLAELNQCHSDFTSPRQMAIVDEFDGMGEVFSLGHWGDVLFDNYGLQKLSEEEEVQFLKSKLLKRGGLQLAETLWNYWALEGDFESYFTARLQELLKTIDIEDTNAKLRAFKSKYWAPRWTSVNLSIFEAYHPITLPYYDNRMCEWICTVPETYLANRQLQIGYIKKRNPELAKISWQDHRPFNLYNNHKNKIPYNLPYRIGNKLKRELKGLMGQAYVQRNWELQLKGQHNKKELETVFENTKIKNWIGSEIVETYTKQFYDQEPLEAAHGLNMLLVLAKCYEKQWS